MKLLEEKKREAERAELERIHEEEEEEARNRLTNNLEEEDDENESTTTTATFTSSASSSLDTNEANQRVLKTTKYFLYDPELAEKIFDEFESVKDPKKLIKKSKMEFVEKKIENVFNRFMVQHLFGDVVEKVGNIQNKLANDTLIKCVTDRTRGRLEQIAPLLEGAARQKKKKIIRRPKLSESYESED